MSVGRIARRILTAAESGGAMSLSDWAAESGIEPTATAAESNAVSVVIDQFDPHRSKLWNLSDYSVSTVSGIVMWLVPKAWPGSDAGGEAIDPVGSQSHQNQTLKHILELAEENMKGQDGYEMIAEWARKAIN